MKNEKKQNQKNYDITWCFFTPPTKMCWQSIARISLKIHIPSYNPSYNPSYIPSYIPGSNPGSNPRILQLYR